jgi:hypothetical protein
MTNSRPGKTLDRPIATKSSAFPALLAPLDARKSASQADTKAVAADRDAHYKWSYPMG